MFARGIARILFAEGIGELNCLQFMLQQGYAPCNLVLLQNLWFIVGADSISARATTRNHVMVGRGQDPSLRHYFIRECRGAHCAPVRFSGNTRFSGRTLFAPTAAVRSDVGGGVAGSRSDQCPGGALNRTSGPALLAGGHRFGRQAPTPCATLCYCKIYGLS